MRPAQHAVWKHGSSGGCIRPGLAGSQQCCYDDCCLSGPSQIARQFRYCGPITVVYCVCDYDLQHNCRLEAIALPAPTFIYTSSPLLIIPSLPSSLSISPFSLLGYFPSYRLAHKVTHYLPHPAIFLLPPC